MKKTIKEQVKVQVKEQVSKILPKIKKSVNKQLKGEVLTRSSNEAKTSNAVAADLSKLELKKILIYKMENNKSINRSVQQKTLYKALVDAYEIDKDNLATYGETVTFKRHRDDEDDDEEPSAGSNRGTLAQNEGPRESFNKLMDIPLDFSAFVLNRLKVDTLTPELLVGPTFELMKGSCKINKEFACDVYFKHIIVAITKLEIVEWHNYKHLDWITVRRDDDKLYTFKEGDYKRLRFQDIEDMLLLLVQGKLRVEDLQLGVKSYQKNLNLTKPDTYRADLKQNIAYTAYSNPRGFIYQNKHKKNRLMRIDELYKFSNGTLNDVRSALDDILKQIRMEYLPQIVWRNVDRERAGAIIQAIDQLRNR
ncbi:hypothetical protein Tco_1170027, partial [Tanacetum coccineum]